MLLWNGPGRGLGSQAAKDVCKLILRQAHFDMHASRNQQLAVGGLGVLSVHSGKIGSPTPGNSYETGPAAGGLPLARPRPSFGVSTIWAFDDFTAENGATRVVPRSHLSGCQPDPARTDYGEIPIEAPAGSVLVWEGRTWHAAGLNVSDHPRYGVVTYFCAPIIRSLGNLTYGMRSETRDAMGPDLLKLAGFTPWNSYGMTDDPYADVARAGDDTAGRLG